MNDQAEKLRQAISKLKNKHGEISPEIKQNLSENKNARVITVTSGKGGVGKTSITLNIAIALGQMGIRVVVIDADFGLANIDVMLGMVPQFTLLDVIEERKSIFEILAEGPNNIKFISGGSGVDELIKLEKTQLLRFLDKISILDKVFDIVLIDTGAGLSENVMSFVMAADEVLLVTTPEPTSVTDAYALIKMISHRNKDKNVRLVVNRADTLTEAMDIMDKFVLVADRFLGLKIQKTGFIMNDQCVTKAIKKQQPFYISYPKCLATKYINDITGNLIDTSLQTRITSTNGIRGFIGRLISNVARQST